MFKSEINVLEYELDNGVTIRSQSYDNINSIYKIGDDAKFELFNNGEMVCCAGKVINVKEFKEEVKENCVVEFKV